MLQSRTASDPEVARAIATHILAGLVGKLAWHAVFVALGTAREPLTYPSGDREASLCFAPTVLIPLALLCPRAQFEHRRVEHCAGALT